MYFSDARQRRDQREKGLPEGGPLQAEQGIRRQQQQQRLRGRRPQGRRRRHPGHQHGHGAVPPDQGSAPEGPLQAGEVLHKEDRPRGAAHPAVSLHSVQPVVLDQLHLLRLNFATKGFCFWYPEAVIIISMENDV